MQFLGFCYMFIQLVVPRVVRIADVIEAISCTTNLTVSFFVIMVKVLIG